MKPQKLTYQQRMLIQAVGIHSFLQILGASPGFFVGHIIVVGYDDLDHLMRFAHVFGDVNKITKTGHLPLLESFNFGNFNIRDTLWTNVDRHPSTPSPSSAPYIDASRFAFLPDQNLQLQTMWVCVLEKNCFWACYFVKSWYILKQTMGVLG